MIQDSFHFKSLSLSLLLDTYIIIFSYNSINASDRLSNPRDARSLFVVGNHQSGASMRLATAETTMTIDASCFGFFPLSLSLSISPLTLSSMTRIRTMPHFKTSHTRSSLLSRTYTIGTASTRDTTYLVHFCWLTVSPSGVSESTSQRGRASKRTSERANARSPRIYSVSIASENRSGHTYTGSHLYHIRLTLFLNRSLFELLWTLHSANAERDGCAFSTFDAVCLCTWISTRIKYPMCISSLMDDTRVLVW